MPESSGTWTNATHITVAVYRGARMPSLNIDGHSNNVGSTNWVRYQAVTPTTYPPATANAWYAGFAAHLSATDLETPPPGMVNRAAGGTEAVVHDTNGVQSTNWAVQDVTVNATNLRASFVSQVPAAVSGTISFVGAAAGNGTSITIPAGYQIGDLIVICAFRLDGSNAHPTIPSGYTQLSGVSGGGCGAVVAGRIATAADAAPFTPIISVY